MQLSLAQKDDAIGNVDGSRGEFGLATSEVGAALLVMALHSLCNDERVTIDRSMPARIIASAGFKQEPPASSGFIEPDLDQAGGRYVIVFIAHAVRLAQA